DDFRRERSDRVYTENFAVFRLRNHLDEAFMTAEDTGLAIAKEWELAGLDFVASIASLLFRQADRADLRLAIRSVGAALAVKRLHLFPCHASYGDNSFHGSGVRELGKSGNDIADGI